MHREQGATRTSRSFSPKPGTSAWMVNPVSVSVTSTGACSRISVSESEILLQAPVDVTETETGFTIHADVPGFGEKDLEVRVAPCSLCITGKRQELSDQKEGTTIYSERRSKHIFRVVGLPSEIDPGTVNTTVGDGLLEIKLLKVGLSKKVPLAKAATV